MTKEDVRMTKEKAARMTKEEDGMTRWEAEMTTETP
jgi:hypothetical protein